MAWEGAKSVADNFISNFVGNWNFTIEKDRRKVFFTIMGAGILVFAVFGIVTVFL